MPLSGHFRELFERFIHRQIVTTVFKNLIASIPFCLFSLVAFGQTPKVDSLSVYELKEVKVDGKNEKRLRSALPTQTITSKEIEDLNASNIADVAKHFAGVTVKDYGGIGGLKTISVRGLGSAHTGVSYDGLMVSDIQSGQIDLSQFSLQSISSITLDNGQPMNLLQSARMFASSSVLSLQTKLSTYDSAHSLSGYATFKTGSFGLLNPSFMLEKYFTSKFAITLSANGTKADGKYPFKLNVNPYGTNIIESKRLNTDVKSLKSELNIFYNITPLEQLSFKSTQYYSDRGIPGSVVFYNYNDATGRVTDKNYLSQFHYENKNSSTWQYLISAKYSNQNTRYTEVDNKYSSFPDSKRFDNYIQNEYYLSSAVQYRPISNMTLAASLDWWYNNLFSETNLDFKKDTKPTRKTSLGNISMKYVAERFSFGGNILYTNTQETADSTFAAPNLNKLSPTVFASLQALDDGSLTLRAFYKNTFRSPTFTELYYHDFGYKNLLPEKSNQINLGITYNTKRFPSINDFSCTVDAYYNRINDKITIVYGMPFSSVRNIGVVKIKGCDINISASKNINPNNKLQINANYTFQLAQNFENNQDTYGDIIPYTPIHSGSASLTYTYKRIDIGYNLLFAGKRYSGQNSDVNNYLEPYTDHSVFCKYLYKKLSLTAEVINFTNINYSIIKYYPMPGRNYRFSINYKF